MRAVFIEEFGDPENLVIKDVPSPEPMLDEVLIEVQVAGVNYPDLLVVAGTYQTLSPLPFTPGKEGAGIVRQIGANVSGLRVGDRVSFELEAGAFAEFVVVRKEHCFPIPEGVSMITAAALGLAYQTAYFALTADGRLQADEWVLVLGASGGVGTAAVQLSKAMGAKVIAAVGTPSKSEFVRTLGAHAIVDVSMENLDGPLREQVSAISDRGGVDIVIDPVGGRFFEAALRTLLPRGRMVVVGFAGGLPAVAKSNYLLIKHISVVGSNWGFAREEHLDKIAEVQAEIFRLAETGVIRSPVTRTFPMESISEALRTVRERGVMGKLVIEMPACSAENRQT